MTALDSRSKPPFRGVRWWWILGIGFAVLVCACAPLALATLLFIYIGTMDTTGPTLPLLAIVAVVLLVVPLLGALAIATVAEFLLRKWGQWDRLRPGWRHGVFIALVVLSPIVILPRWYREFSGSSDRAGDFQKIAAHDRRPIALSDSVGFCAPPVWSVRAGLPQVEFAVRPRAAGRHRVYLSAYDRSGRSYGTTMEVELVAGVNRVSAPLCDPKKPKPTIAWPILVNQLALGSISATGEYSHIDARAGDSLYLVRPGQ